MLQTTARQLLYCSNCAAMPKHEHGLAHRFRIRGRQLSSFAGFLGLLLQACSSMYDGGSCAPSTTCSITFSSKQTTASKTSLLAWRETNRSNTGAHDQQHSNQHTGDEGENLQSLSCTTKHHPHIILQMQANTMLAPHHQDVQLCKSFKSMGTGKYTLTRYSYTGHRLAQCNRSAAALQVVCKVIINTAPRSFASFYLLCCHFSGAAFTPMLRLSMFSKPLRV